MYYWIEDERISHERIDVSQHFLSRLNERSREHISNVNHFVSLALRKGKNFSNYHHARERGFLESKEVSGCKALAYNGYCLIYDEKDKTLITIYKLPEWFDRAAHSRTKQQRRDWKAFRLEEQEYLFN